MRISTIRRQSRRPDRVTIHFEGGERLSLAAEIVLAAGLRKGAELAEVDLARLTAQDEGWKAREAALRLLAHRPRAERELARKLRDRGYPESAVEGAMAKVRDLGLIDDEAFAREYALQRIRARPAGARRLVEDLRRKGIAADDARRAAAAAIEESGVSDLELARAAHRKFPRRAGEPEAKRNRRLQGFLSRRGFSPSTIRQLVREDRADSRDE
jgi:regulatory protein